MTFQPSLIIRSSPNVHKINVFTEEEEWGGASTCMKFIVESAFLPCNAGTTFSRKILRHRSAVTVCVFHLDIGQRSSKKKGPTTKEAVKTTPNCYMRRMNYACTVLTRIQCLQNAVIMRIDVFMKCKMDLFCPKDVEQQIWFRVPFSLETI